MSVFQYSVLIFNGCGVEIGTPFFRALDPPLHFQIQYVVMLLNAKFWPYCYKADKSTNICAETLIIISLGTP